MAIEVVELLLPESWERELALQALELEVEYLRLRAWMPDDEEVVW